MPSDTKVMFILVFAGDTSKCNTAMPLLDSFGSWPLDCESWQTLVECHYATPAVERMGSGEVGRGRKMLARPTPLFGCHSVSLCVPPSKCCSARQNKKSHVAGSSLKSGMA